MINKNVLKLNMFMKLLIRLSMIRYIDFCCLIVDT